MAGYLGNLARSAVGGLTFNNADEMEAAIRAAAQGDLARYAQIKARINAEHERWAQNNWKADMAADTAGMLIPGVVGAFVPGGQGATVGAGARIAKAMAEPVTAGLERFAPNVAWLLDRALPRASRYIVPVADEVATGAVQSVGSARDMRSAPQQVAEDAPLNVAGSLAVRGATDVLGKGLAVFRNRKRAK